VILKAFYISPSHGFCLVALNILVGVVEDEVLVVNLERFRRHRFQIHPRQSPNDFSLLRLNYHGKAASHVPADVCGVVPLGEIIPLTTLDTFQGAGRSLDLRYLVWADGVLQAKSNQSIMLPIL
jgi:hypothetical protein